MSENLANKERTCNSGEQTALVIQSKDEPHVDRGNSNQKNKRSNSSGKESYVNELNTFCCQRGFVFNYEYEEITARVQRWNAKLVVEGLFIGSPMIFQTAADSKKTAQEDLSHFAINWFDGNPPPPMRVCKIWAKLEKLASELEVTLEGASSEQRMLASKGIREWAQKMLNHSSEEMFDDLSDSVTMRSHEQDDMQE